MSFFECDDQINISNVGASNLITNTGILSILENVACKHSDSVGFGINDVLTTHMSWVLLSWKVSVFKRAQYGSKIKVRTWAKCASKFHTYRDFEILDETGNLICIATSKWALIDTQKASISKITDDIIEKYHPDTRNVFDDLEIQKISEPEHYSNIFTYTVQRRDIDINQHMHNLNYLSLAYETLPQEVYDSPECNNIEIMYKKSIILGDSVKCFYSYYDNSNYVTIKSADEKHLHAIIKLY